MTRLEAGGVIVAAVVILLVGLWLFLPRIWPRYRSRTAGPERLIFPSEPGGHVVMVGPGGRLADLAGEYTGEQMDFDWVYDDLDPGHPDDWLSADPPTWDFPPKTALTKSAPVPGEVRPWAYV